MENKKENFRRIATNRTNKIIDMISLLGNLANSSFYEFSQEQINSIFEAIQNELNTQKAKFSQPRQNRKRKFEL